MATIGHYEFPEYTFGECLGWIEKVKRDKVQTFETFLTILGHKNPKSSGVNLKMGALNKYFGLLERDGTSIKLTPLAENIVFDVGERTRAEACHESVGRVRLLSALYTKLGPEYHSNDFIPVLQEVSGAKPNEIEAKAEVVERLYKDAIPYLRMPGHPTPTGPGTSAAPTAGAEVPRTKEGAISDSGLVAPPVLKGDPRGFHIYQTGDNYVRLERDADVLEVAKGVIDVWLAQTKKTPRPSP